MRFFGAADAVTSRAALHTTLQSTTPPWDVDAWRKTIRDVRPPLWQELGEQQALTTFHLAADRVPAYRDFLLQAGVAHEKIHTIDEFRRHVPYMEKENYLRVYPLESLCLDGKMIGAPMISLSSGSTGKAMYWPRGDVLTQEGAMIHEWMFLEGFAIEKKRTLVVDCFSMGAWIAGTYTMECVRALAARGYDLQIVTPGIELRDIVSVIGDLHASYQQIILAGYPPLVKDVIDALQVQNIPVALGKIRFLFAAEGFSEPWRAALHARVGVPAGEIGSLSIYGTAEAAIMGHESPQSVALRRWVDSTPDASLALFGDERLPSLVHYYPQWKYAELTETSELAFTCRNAGIPLVRYNMHDVGGITTWDALLEKSEALGYHPRTPITNTAPLLYVFGRMQRATSIYAVNIYLENVQGALAHAQLQESLTGKSAMGNANDEKWDQYWWVAVEAAPGVAVSPQLEARVRDILIAELQARNSEYRRLCAAIADRAHPLVRVLPHGDPSFRVNTKLQWNGGTLTPSEQNPSPDDVVGEE